MSNKFERKFILTKVVKTFSTISVGRLFILVSDFDAYGDCAFKQCLFIKINENIGCELNKPGEYCALNSEVEVYPVLNTLV